MNHKGLPLNATWVQPRQTIWLKQNDWSGSSGTRCFQEKEFFIKYLNIVMEFEYPFLFKVYIEACVGVYMNSLEKSHK